MQQIYLYRVTDFYALVKWKNKLIETQDLSAQKIIQWGSEYQTSPVFEWLKRGWLPNGLVLECHIGQMDAILFSFMLVHYLNDRV